MIAFVRSCISVFLVGSSVAPGASAAEPPADMATIISNDRWSLAQGTDGKQPIITRFRSELRSRPDVGAFPRRIVVTWKYAGDARGMPAIGDIKRMQVFEGRLSKAVEPDLKAVLTAVTTHGGRRVWLYYTGDVAEFGRRLNQMPQEKTPYPITLESADDPKWEYLHNEILAGIEDQKK